jgi:hypothetical protein
MSGYIEAFCDNFHKYKDKNDLNRRIYFYRNETEASFFWASEKDLLVKLPYRIDTEIKKFFK